jgi:ABC transporter substrate binding protein
MDPRRTRAAGRRQAARHRVASPGHGHIPRPMVRRYGTAIARTRLDRGSHRRARISLWRGVNERYAEIAAEFVRLNVAVIVTSGPAVPAAKQATSVIPIIFPLSGDPVAAGLVASLAHPGGNVTGLSQQIPDAAGKRVELLREAIPSLRRLAILVNVGEPNSVLDAHEAQAAARTLGLEVATL